jgi:hypothetical protein
MSVCPAMSLCSIAATDEAHPKRLPLDSRILNLSIRHLFGDLFLLFFRVAVEAVGEDE